jgi:hypothetical protein
VKPDERGFEDAITSSLVEAGGYRLAWGTDQEWADGFIPMWGLHTGDLFAFLEDT